MFLHRKALICISSLTYHWRQMRRESVPVLLAIVALDFVACGGGGWASFDDARGALNGTPRVTDVGLTQAISISVSDSRASASLLLFDVK
jgi:hypothetical protein